MFTASQYHFAIDCDEVLVHISKKWVNKCINDPLIKEYILDTSTQEQKENHVEYLQSLEDNVLKREKYYLDQYLDLKDPQVVKRYLELYNLDDTFYDDLPPSLFYNSLVNIFKSSSIINEISIISVVGDSVDFPNVLSKKKFLLNLFRPFRDICNTNFYFVENGKTKSSIINENNINYTTFIDDHMTHISDVIVNTNSVKKDFGIPLYGYNTNLDIIGLSNIETVKDQFKVSDIYYFGNT